jgi:hypothetical protein
MVEVGMRQRCTADGEDGHGGMNWKRRRRSGVPRARLWVELATVRVLIAVL